jgi:hypothetical protein
MQNISYNKMEHGQNSYINLQKQTYRLEHPSTIHFSVKLIHD